MILERPRGTLPLMRRSFVAAGLSAGLLGVGGAGAASLRVPVPAGAAARSFKAIAARFTAETGTAVDLVEMPLDDLRQKLILDLSTGAGQMDVVVLNNTWLGELRRFLIDLSPNLAPGNGFDMAAVVPSMAALFAEGGHQYALPVRIGGRVLAYRTDLFRAAGIAAPPKTWAEFVDVAKRLTKPAENRYGFVAPMGQGLNMVDTWGVFLTSYGGDFLTPDGTRPAFADAAGKAATRTFVALYRDDKVMPQDALEYDDSGAIAAMASGRAAMMLAFSPWLGALNNPKQSKVAGLVDAAPHVPVGAPNGVSMSNGWGFGVSKASSAQAAATRFARFAASPAVQLQVARDLGNSPTVTSVFSDPDYLKANPYALNVLQALKGARPQPNRPGWATVADDLGRSLSLALTGQETPDEALDKASARAVRSLRR